MNKKLLFLLIVILLITGFEILGKELSPKLMFEDDELYKPYKMNVYNNHLYILDSADQSIKVLNQDKELVRTFGSRGQGLRVPVVMKTTGIIQY